MNSILYVICLCQWISTRTILDAFEINRQESNAFLQQIPISIRKRYELSREVVETTRESCLNEYQHYQQMRPSSRRQSLSPVCQKYCAETNDCQQESETSACLDASWPIRTLKFSLKFQRICYVRITEVLRYHQAEQLCHKHGLQLAVIDNLLLLERLKESQMFNTTCKGQCPEARGYYIGLRRMMDELNPMESKWIWSNNVTWTENETQCDERITNHSSTWLKESNVLCYNGSDGEQKVTVWNQGEPNNHRLGQFQAGEQCVEIIARTDPYDDRWDQIGKLNDIPCHKPTLGVICQKEDTKPVNHTRFDYFATLIGFNESEPMETDGNDLLGNLLANFDGSISPSLDAVAAMAAALEGLLVLPSFTTEQAGNVLNVVDQLVNVTGHVEVEDDSLKVVTNKLLNFLDIFSGKIQIDEDTSTSFIYDNMNTSLVDLTVDHWDDFQDQQWFTIHINGSDESPNSIVELNLPALRRHLTTTDHYRLIETVFSNFNLFPQVNSSNSSSQKPLMIGMPISYQIANWTRIHTHEDLVRFQIRIPDSMRSANLSCAYWSFEENNGSWISDQGCRFVAHRHDYVECYCNHLTHFALLMLPESKNVHQVLTKVQEFILTFVTYIGIALSIFGLIITLITYTLFRCSQRNRIHASLFMLCASILCVNCLYIPFSLTKPILSSGYRNPFCNVIGFFFHYFLITSFFWMFIMAIIQYMQFVRIFNSHISHFFVKASCIGWFLPLIFPFLVIILGTNGGYIGEHRCWINSRLLLYLTLVLPIAIIILLNSILFIFTIKSIFHHDPSINTHQSSRSKLQIGASMCCFASIGCTWIFGILVLLRPSFLHQLVFCIFNSLQGFLIFLFHIYLSKPKRELWQTFFIQHGLHQRPNSSSISGQTQLITKSQSSTANLSSLTRPVKFRFTSSLSNHLDPIGATASLNPSFTDQSLNNSTVIQTIKPTSNAGIGSQADFFRERLQQKTRQTMNQLYA